jgi:hypothetical protein
MGVACSLRRAQTSKFGRLPPATDVAKTTAGGFGKFLKLLETAALPFILFQELARLPEKDSNLD